MKGTSNDSIYVRIAEHFMEQVITGNLPPGAKAPSVRETAMSMGVTPNTAANAHSVLKDMGVLAIERGVGAIVQENAEKICRDYMQGKFAHQELPVLRKRMQLLGITNEQLVKMLETANLEKGDVK